MTTREKLIASAAALVVGLLLMTGKGCELPVWVGPGPVVPAVTVGPIRTLILYKSEEIYPPEISAAIWSDKLRTYLDAHCEKDSGASAWRVWDDNVTPTETFKAPFDAAIAASGGKRPWLHIEQRNKVVYDGQIVSEENTLATLKRWGGD